MRSVTCWLLAASCFAAPMYAQLTARQQALSEQVTLVESTVGTGRLGTGSIQYDPGAPADSYPPTGLSFVFWGNRFDSRNGQPLSAGTVSQLSFYIGPTASFNAFIVADPSEVISGAPGISAVPYAFNVANPGSASSPVGSVFFAGLAVGSPFDSVGIRSATTNSQGFHATQRPFSPASASTPLPGLNAMVRASGSIIIPVELLEFEIE